MVTCPPQLSLAPTERAAHSQTHAPRRWLDLHLSPAGQSPRHAGNGPAHGSKVVLVVNVVGDRVVVVVAGSVLVVDGRVALVVVVEVVVVDLVLSGQTKRRPLSCSALATVPSRSASCCVRSRHGGHMPRAVSLRAVCS